MSTFSERGTMTAGRLRSISTNSERPSAIVYLAERAFGSEEGYRLGCCRISGNGISLLTSACLFGLITSVQYGYAIKVGSVALAADCMSMGVDALAFLGNLFADCFPPESPSKRRVELTMSGLSHSLLLGFTCKFVFDAFGDAQVTSDDDSPGEREQMGWVVFGFATGGLIFDLLSLLAYKLFGTRAHDCHGHADDALTGGINTNMFAALLHVVSDLARSTTTFVEGIVLLNVKSIPATRADGMAALVVCSIIAVGAAIALFMWAREVRQYVTRKKVPPDGYTSLNADGECTHPGCDFVTDEAPPACEDGCCDEGRTVV